MRIAAPAALEPANGGCDIKFIIARLAPVMSIGWFQFIGDTTWFDTIGTKSANDRLNTRYTRGYVMWINVRSGFKVVLIALCVHWASSSAQALPERVAAQLASAGLPATALSFVVMRPGDGVMVLAATPERPMQPASTLKLLTSAVALDTLGRGYGGLTELRTAASLQGGVLAGDLVLRGLGDTDLDVDAFRGMLRTLRNQGIHEIRGDLLLDRSWIVPPRPYLGAAPFDETPEFRYNVIPDAISLNTNLLQLEIVADTDQLTVRMSPALEGVSVASTLKLGHRPCPDWEDDWLTPAVTVAANGTYQIELRGEFPRNCVATTQVNVLDRTVFADRLFRALWRELGGTFTGMSREASASVDTRLLAQHRGRSLSETLRDINKRSDNPITRLTFLALGHALPQGGGVATNAAIAPSETTTAASAERSVRNWLRDNQIDHSGLHLENGSGLSRTEKIQPRQLAEVLRVALRRPWAPEFLASLPVAGLDGGLQRRLTQQGLAGVARLKTGTLRDVTALAGYVPDRRGRTVIVVAMVNHPAATSKIARPILDALVEEVATLDSESVVKPISFNSGQAAEYGVGP